MLLVAYIIVNSSTFVTVGLVGCKSEATGAGRKITQNKPKQQKKKQVREIHLDLDPPR